MKDEKNLFRIAIDGPSGAGKSTVAKLLAKEYAIDYVDTGAMYRAMGLKLIRTNTPCEEGDELLNLLENTDVDYRDWKVFLDGEDVSDHIRTEEVSKMASDCSAFASVRHKLDSIQKNIGRTRNVVMDGRDICTVVIPDAEHKFYITASAEERARRRYLELKQKGQNPDYEKVLEDINKRDYNDTHRDVNPLRIDDDAVVIDTTEMDIEQVVKYTKDIIDGKGAEYVEGFNVGDEF